LRNHVLYLLAAAVNAITRCINVNEFVIGARCSPTALQRNPLFFLCAIFLCDVAAERTNFHFLQIVQRRFKPLGSRQQVEHVEQYRSSISDACQRRPPLARRISDPNAYYISRTRSNRPGITVPETGSRFPCNLQG